MITTIVCFIRINCVIWFSNPSGFYDSSFPLAIKGGGIFDIYYTLDGSEPTRESSLYHPGSAIIISDASECDNVLSKRTDISTGYGEYISSPSDFAVPDQKVDKCTIVRAAAISKRGTVISSIQSVYFVGFQNKPEYQDISVVSIYAEEDDLFGYESGILVAGKTFDDYVQASLDDSGKFNPKEWYAPYYWWWPANYRNEGQEWERKAQITVFDPQREIVLNQQCGIRIHGGGSRGYPCRSIRCIAREEYAGNNTFFVNWFGENITPQKFVLYSGGDDYRFKLKDYLGQTFAESLNVATQKCKPCCLFINGEYWGFYFLTENYNKNYISDHYGVKDSNVIMVKNGSLKEGNESDMQHYLDMKDFISLNDMSVAKNYQEACELIDVNSYIDYYAFQIYIGRNNDWPKNNYALWRTQKSESVPYGDCKWRWMLFDLNSGGMSNVTLQEDTLTYVLENDSVFASLWNSPEFRHSFLERIHYIGSTLLSADNCTAFIDDYCTSFQAPIELHNLRFYNSKNEEAYTTYVENMRTFFTNRYSVVQQFLSDHADQ